MKFKPFFIILFSLIVTFLLASCGSGNAENKTDTISDSAQVKNENSTEQEGKKKTEDAVPVEVTEIKLGTISDYILLSSNLETEQMADIYSRVQGLIEKIRVEEGDFVTKGQVLMELEDDEYKLAEERARLNYLKQKADFTRMEEMYEKDLLSKEEFEQAEFTTRTFEVEWEQAKLNLSYTLITAPISGVIGVRSCKPGDRIQPADKLFSVINTAEMIAVVYVPEKELGSIAKNQTAYITSDNLPHRRFTGWIKRVSPVVDPQSGTFKVTVGVKNPENKLRAGMFINAHIIVSTHENAILIPKTAIVYENEKMNIFVVRDSLAHKVELKVGFQDHEKVESLDDVAEGEKVIVVGQAGLKDQTKVKIVSERDNELISRRKIIGSIPG